jgi:hypothetical protein
MLGDMWWSWIDKSAHIESDKFMDNHAFMPLHSSAQLEVTILRIMCTIIIQYPNSELHMPVWLDPCLTSQNGSSMIRGSRFIHLRWRDHPVDLEKKESLVVLRRGTKNNNVIKRCKRYDHQEITCKDPLSGDTKYASNSRASSHQRYYCIICTLLLILH